MLRMEISLILVLAFIAFMYFTAEKQHTRLHKTFATLLIVMIVHLGFDAATIYTVNHLEAVPGWLNSALHRVFIGSIILAMYLFYQYIAVLSGEKNGKAGHFDIPASAFLVLAELGTLLLPIEYSQSASGNFSSGPCAWMCYACSAFYLSLCVWLLIASRKQMNAKEKSAIGVALFVELTVSVLQAFHPTWLISGMGLTLMTLSFYLLLENPDILRAELTEQKMSMRYLKSQVNPHFLYNTLDTIRIQAQLNGDKKVADLLLRLADFFRLSVKVDHPQVPLEEELELAEAYMDLICARYPELKCDYDIDPELLNCSVPNFILQPIVENSLLHGLKSKGYRGEISICAIRSDENIELQIRDTGGGFVPEKKGACEKKSVKS